MDNHYSQPYYGFPNAHPPPQMHPPVPQPEDKRGPHHVQQLPGINLNSHAHNNQQPPFAAPAWPPQLPPDANLWALFQSGTFPPPNFPPPPFPGMAFPPSSLPHAPHNTAFAPPPLPPAPQHMPMPPQLPHPLPQPAAQAPAISNGRIQDIMDSEKEDGELSEADAASQPPKAAVQDAPPRENPQTPQEQLRQDREAAKQFIKLLHGNNVPYRILAEEQLDPELLRGLYQSLNLPSEPAPILPPKPHSAASSAPAVKPLAPVQQNKLPTVKTNVAPAPPTKAVASPTTPVDRKDYVKRLQAAKAAAKQAGSVKPTSPSQHALSAKPITPAPTTKTPQPAATPTAKPPVTDEQRARNTELIKQRLEAIKARQKPAGTVNNNAAAPAIPSTPTGQTQTAQAAATPTAASTGQSHTHSFSGIPGLFMNTPPVSNAPVPITSRPAPSAPQKQPAPTDTTKTSILQAPVTPHNRSIGQSQYNQQDDDSMIIEVSEDESNGSDMDIEDDQPAPQSVQTPHRPMGSLPSRAASAFPANSIVGAPGAQTPSTVAREKELVDKEKQLVAMRETLKKKLAEKRERDRAAAAAATTSAATTPSSLQQPSTPVLPPQIATPTKLPNPMMESAPVNSRGPPVDTDSSKTSPAKDTAQIRRAEIQSKLPTLDAEIASNANRMAQLMREMEQLTAQNERIAKDKAQLTKELEGLGVDTEGMSHAELRAKKDEIEREQPSEPNRPLQEPLPAPLPAASEAPQLQEPTASASRFSTQTINKTLDVDAAPETSVKSVQHQSRSEAPQVPRMDNAIPGIQTSATALGKDASEDTYSPPPPAGMNLEIGEVHSKTDGPQRSLTAQTATTPSSEEEGEVEMSVSEGDEDEEDDEPEYDPEEHAIVTDIPTQDAQPTGPSIPRSHAPTEDEEEAYEPPDIDQEMSDVGNDEANDASHAGQIEADDGAMDIATSSDDSSDDSDSDSDFDSDEQSTEDPAAETSISANKMSHQSTNIADDIAPELQSENKSAAAAVEPTPVPVDEDEPVKFTPYESPLRMFKSYRYHPSYAQDISGGFLSLTFSHQIDPEKPFCQYESAGGSCNDSECPDQHFREAAITGDKLLVQLGTANPGKTSEEKQRWNDGLRGVLKELRQKNIKDPNGIAAEIARYRRQFLNDDTRVVNL
ncbi:zf-C3H1 multi-domain protein [Pyrenophora teres f. teres]|uniref:Zf-C3H1 multi-domain protein n=1 Tax=Pyrenophora teres f. teres TaxID=97479 RepID=A0A6S6VI00_9PLEO|nr:zf-C3H1 multi-domain protein [Pyrenophora teres f. teres]